MGTTAATGTGLNIFSNPCAVYGSLRYIQLSSDTRTGRANPMRGLPVRNMARVEHGAAVNGAAAEVG